MDLPTFLQGDIEELQNFFELMFETLRAGLSNAGWTVPQLTTAQITAISQPPDLNDSTQYMPNGTIWFNTDLAKLQVQTAIVLGVGATIETVTSV
jgi:hypothetical protein